MDRLEIIRKKNWELNNRDFPKYSNKRLCKNDIIWLISEIERLGKIIKCKDILLVAYRLGTNKGVEKALDELDRLQALKQGG